MDTKDIVLVNQRAIYIRFEVISIEIKSYTLFKYISRYNIYGLYPVNSKVSYLLPL